MSKFLQSIIHINNQELDFGMTIDSAKMHHFVKRFLMCFQTQDSAESLRSLRCITLTHALCKLNYCQLLTTVPKNISMVLKENNAYRSYRYRLQTWELRWNLRLALLYNTGATIMWIILWEILMVEQTFFSPRKETWLLVINWYTRVASRVAERLNKY